MGATLHLSPAAGAIHLPFLVRETDRLKVLRPQIADERGEDWVRTSRNTTLAAHNIVNVLASFAWNRAAVASGGRLSEESAIARHRAAVSTLGARGFGRED